jgi:hypothetical protein
MQITALSVEGVGRFATMARVEGFSAGVNVLAAGNEAGKSTLFKAVRTCLFARHDSKNQEIRDLATDDGQLPTTVQLSFVENGKSYVIRKSFLRSPSATLTEDGREIARSKQADEAVWDILGLNPGSGRSLDEGAFGLLWVGQGGSFQAPVPSQAASSVLNSAIESEVGALVGGERARRVLEDLNMELRRSLTDNGRLKSDGQLDRALKEFEKWNEDETEAEAKLRALEQQFTKLLQLRARQSEVRDPAAAKRLADELLDARRSLADARIAAQEIRRFEAEESGARRALENAAHRAKQLRELTARIDANRESEQSHEKILPERRAREQEARTALFRTHEQMAEVDRSVQNISGREQQLEKLATASVRGMRKDELLHQLKSLEQATTNLIHIDAQIAQIKLKPKAVDDLDELERQISSLDAQLSAAASHLAVDVKPAGTGHVRIGNSRPKGNYAGAVLAPTKIIIGDLAVITVTPAANPRYEKRESLNKERSSLLESNSVSSVAQARALLAKRRNLEADRKEILAELRTLKATSDPAPAIAKLKSELVETDLAIESALTAAKRKDFPNQTELDEERLGLSQERASLDASKASLEGMREQQQAAVEQGVEARSRAESKLELVRKSISEDLAMCSDADRRAREEALFHEVTSLEAGHQMAVAVLEAKRQTTPDAAEIERREVRCERLEQAIENQKNELMELERDIGLITGQIQTAGGDGVGETLAIAKEQRALAERDAGRIKERIATLQLLHETITNSLKEGRERYYEPVRRHLRPFLNNLFQGAELELGDDFAIAGLRRGSDRSEMFRRLSDGTQEQVAVLVRLAMGAMLAEQGRAVPIFLDDALIYSDDDRIKFMFDALARAGKNQQVIVLTCRLRTFAQLGGHSLRVQLSP